jgi:uncharacterized protein
MDLLGSPVAHSRTTRTNDHRPWPLPGRAWVMGQTWTDLLFAHWQVAPGELERVVPRELPIDLREGSAWLGVTPFRVRNLHTRRTWPVPFLSEFPEINVRTYVTYRGRPGIYFLSLDADSTLAVAAARRLYRLPYFRARMATARHGDSIRYLSDRCAAGRTPPAGFRGRYRPVGPVVRPTSGSVEHWLTERYCLYTLDERHRVLRGQIHHPPWPLQAAEADIETNTMAVQAGIDLVGEPLVHYSRRQDVVFWSLEPA